MPWLVHAFSTRSGGVSRAPAVGLNLGFIESDTRHNVEENRRLFFEQIEAQCFALVSLRQLHSTRIYRVVRGECGAAEYLPGSASSPDESKGGLPLVFSEDGAREGDALVSDQAGCLLSVRTADCLPILIVDSERRAIAAIHAGWRGTVNSIVAKTVDAMRQWFGSRPSDLLAAIGPSIRACCYEVGEEVVEAYCNRFSEGQKFFQIRTRSSRAGIDGQSDLDISVTQQDTLRQSATSSSMYLDLVTAATSQLEIAGVPQANVEVADFCTSCRTDLFFSHRNEGPGTGRMMAVIGIRPAS